MDGILIRARSHRQAGPGHLSRVPDPLRLVAEATAYIDDHQPNVAAAAALG